MENANILVVGNGSPRWNDTGTLADGGAFRIETVQGGEEALARVRRHPLPDIVLLDVVQHGAALEILEQLRKAQPLLKILMLACSDDPETAAEAIRLGAMECLPRSCDSMDLQAALEVCLAPARNGSYGERPGDVEEFDDGGFFVAASSAMRKLRAQLSRVAHIDVPVLCLGESGTGKEVIARLIHRLSRRAARPFVKVNCAAVPTELLESELFGYERGAFTGAVRSKPGKFELATKGTLLLDEIAEMPPALQAKLLHVLQDQEFTRLGGSSRVKVDVRVIAATNVDINAAISSRVFREDLYYRLSTFVFRVPALRERREDIPVLLQRYIRVYAERYQLPLRPASQRLYELCLRYAWPGNVRELENFAKRYVIIGEEATNTLVESVREPMARTAAAGGVPAEAPCDDLKTHLRGLKDNAEASVIAQTLKETNWNRKEAARTLKISYKSLLDKIRLYGLDRSPQVISLDDYRVRAEDFRSLG